MTQLTHTQRGCLPRVTTEINEEREDSQCLVVLIFSTLKISSVLKKKIVVFLFEFVYISPQCLYSVISN